jgi:hypothetical protein
MIEIEKKLKDWYHKLTLFKVWVLNYKSDERWGAISEVFPKNCNVMLPYLKTLQCHFYH